MIDFEAAALHDLAKNLIFDSARWTVAETKFFRATCVPKEMDEGYIRFAVWVQPKVPGASIRAFHERFASVFKETWRDHAEICAARVEAKGGRLQIADVRAGRYALGNQEQAEREAATQSGVMLRGRRQTETKEGPVAWEMRVPQWLSKRVVECLCQKGTVKAVSSGDGGINLLEMVSTPNGPDANSVSSCWTSLEPVGRYPIGYNHLVQASYKEYGMRCFGVIHEETEAGSSFGTLPHGAHGLAGQTHCLGRQHQRFGFTLFLWMRLQELSGSLPSNIHFEFVPAASKDTVLGDEGLLGPLIFHLLQSLILWTQHSPGTIRITLTNVEACGRDFGVRNDGFLRLSMRSGHAGQSAAKNEAVRTADLRTSLNLSFANEILRLHGGWAESSNPGVMNVMLPVRCELAGSRERWASDITLYQKLSHFFQSTTPRSNSETIAQEPVKV